MPIFKPGTVVRFGANRETVSHIIIRRSVLLCIWWAMKPLSTPMC